MRFKVGDMARVTKHAAYGAGVYENAIIKITEVTANYRAETLSGAIPGAGDVEWSYNDGLLEPFTGSKLEKAIYGIRD